MKTRFWISDFFDISGGALRALTHMPRRRKEILSQIVSIGVESLPIITLATVFSGVVVSSEIAWHMDKALHTVSMIPGFTGQFILRELGIAIPAMLLISKAGAAITAEIGSMKITEQLDALKLLKINPKEYLVMPIWIGSQVALVCLTLFSIAITLACALGIAILNHGFTAGEYLNALEKLVSARDLGVAVIKAWVFGAVFPLVSCTYGFRCQGGAQGVGTATTQAVVTGTMVTIVIDFVLTYLLVR